MERVETSGRNAAPGVSGSWDGGGPRGQSHREAAWVLLASQVWGAEAVGTFWPLSVSTRDGSSNGNGTVSDHFLLVGLSWPPEAG